MNEPLITNNPEQIMLNRVGKISNFIEYVVQGSVDSIILCFSFISSTIQLSPKNKFEPGGVNLGRIFSVGIPVIIADAFAHSLNSFLVKKAEMEAEYLRQDISKKIKEDVEIDEIEKFYSSGLIYFTVYLIFAFFLLLPFGIAYWNQPFSQVITLIWFIVTAITELVLVGVVKSNFTKSGFLRSLLDVCSVGMVAAGVAFLVGFLFD
jgi:hypothetical protein